MTTRPFRVRAVLFDFDGTLTRPGALDFPRIKAALGAPVEEPILEFLEGIEDEEARAALWRRLEEFEAEAAQASVPNGGVPELIRHLRNCDLGVGILTRNGRRAVEAAFSAFPGIGPADFDAVITRDVPVAPKPAPDGVLEAARLLGVAPGEVLFVGDHWLDIDAGHAAGAVTALLENRAAGEGVRAAHTPDRGGHARPDFVLAELADVGDLVRLGLPLPVGKVPREVLAGFLCDLGKSRTSGDLLLEPRVGEDVAAVEPGAQVLVMKSDPITFTADDIARYVLAVNANDVATSGAVPRWFLATVLLPPGSTPSGVLALLEDLAAECRRFDVILVGGHTEITDAVVRPVVAGTLLGTVAREDLVDKSRMGPGDVIVLTKSAGLEGTAVLAVELEGELRAEGLSGTELEAARDLSGRLSVLPEARVGAACSGVTGMHDVTEGGLATALEEVGALSGCDLIASPGEVAVDPATMRVAECLGLDPLGMLGSGSLLLICRPEGADELQRLLAEARIESREIGRLGRRSAGETRRVRTPEGEPWQSFTVDEVARALESRGGGGLPD